MIGTKYTSEMLAAFAKSPRLRRMDVKVESVVLPAGSTVELDVAVSEYGFTSAVEWLHTESNVFISFYENENENENETSDDPWLRICEPA